MSNYLADKGLKILDNRLFNRIDSAINKYNSMFQEYFVKYEKRLINHYLSERNNPNAKNKYPALFSRTEVKFLQREIMFRYQGGRDMLTGEKFIDIYRRLNPDGLSQSQLNSLSDEEVKEKVITLIHRHHFKTWSQPLQKIDCRISALVGLYRDSHAEVTSNIRVGSTYLNRQYEEVFRVAIGAIMRGEAPIHWKEQYRMEFKADLAHGLIDPYSVNYLYRTTTQAYL